MKGVVFTEFLGLVEEKFGEDVVDDIIEAAELASGGAYTAVGYYDHGEMVALVTHLSDQTKIPAKDLLHVFSEHLMGYFARAYPAFFEAAADTLDFIESVDRHIHVEVRKLYPDAELPSFRCRRRSEHVLEVEYRSVRNFDELAHGLMLHAARHFGETLDIERQPTRPDGAVPFVVTKKADERAA